MGVNTVETWHFSPVPPTHPALFSVQAIGAKVVCCAFRQGTEPGEIQRGEPRGLGAAFECILESQFLCLLFGS